MALQTRVSNLITATTSHWMKTYQATYSQHKTMPVSLSSDDLSRIYMPAIGVDGLSSVIRRQIGRIMARKATLTSRSSLRPPCSLVALKALRLDRQIRRCMDGYPRGRFTLALVNPAGGTCHTFSSVHRMKCNAMVTVGLIPPLQKHT